MGEADKQFTERVGKAELEKAVEDDGLNIFNRKVREPREQRGPSLSFGVDSSWADKLGNAGISVPMNQGPPTPPQTGPVPISLKSPPPAPDLSGMHGPAMTGGLPTVDFSGSGRRMSPLELDRRGAARPDANVDLSNMPQFGAPANDASTAAISPQAGAADGAPISRVVPAHYERGRDPTSDKSYAAQNEVLEAEAKAGVAAAKVRETGDMLKAETYGEMARAKENDRLNYEAHEIQRQAEVQKKTAYADKMASDVTAYRTDPYRFMNNKNADQKFAIMLGSGIGDVLAARKGGPNQFLQSVDAEIQRDIDAQHDELRVKEFGANAARNSLADLRANLGDERASELTIADMTYAQLENQLKEQMARTDSKLHQNAGDQVLNALQDKRVQIQIQREKVMHVNAATVGGGQLAKDLHTVTLPDGRTVSFQTPEDRQKVQERVLASQDLSNIYSQAQQLRTKLTPGFMAMHPIETHNILSELDSLAEKALPAWSTSKGQGQVKEEEAKRYKKSLFPFSRILDPAADRIIAGGVKESAQGVDNIVRTHGGEYVKTGYKTAANGTIQPTAQYTGERAKPTPVAMPKGAKPLVLGGK